jgi:hypothetical protein
MYLFSSSVPLYSSAQCLVVDRGCCCGVVAATLQSCAVAEEFIHASRAQLNCCVLQKLPFCCVAFCIALALAPIQNSLCGPAIPSSHGRSMIVSSTLSFTISCILKGPIRSSYLGQIYPVTAAHGMTSVSLSIGLCFQLVYIQYIYTT